MGTFLMKIRMKFALKKRGIDPSTRIVRTVKRCLTFSHTNQFDNAEKRAKKSFLWFMRENAEKHFKVLRFENTVNHVLLVQRSYRKVLFRRMVRRALMDSVWEKFIKEQKMLAAKTEF